MIESKNKTNKFNDSKKSSNVEGKFKSSSLLHQNQNLRDKESIERFNRKLTLAKLKSHMTEDEAEELIRRHDSGVLDKVSLKERAKSYFKNNFKKDLNTFSKNFLQGLFPDDCNCIICKKEIPRGSKFGLCEKHLLTMPFNDGKICIRCGTPCESESVYCNECQNNHRYFDVARSSVEYVGDCVMLTSKLKFHNCKWIAKYMASMMAETYNANVFDADIIVPTPISKERLAERGYNQSLEIAKSLANVLNLDIAPNTVVKSKHNARQSDLTSRQRRDNVKGVYSLADRAAVKGKKVVIVDDIMTTGSTASEVAKQLKIAGATDVYVIVFASSRSKHKGENFSEFEVIDTFEDKYIVI